jgi:hypothetical protein
MDIGLSVQQATGQVNVSTSAGHVKKRPSIHTAGSCDETRLSVHRSKNHVRLSVFSLLPELLKLLIVHFLDPSNRPSASLLVAAAFQPSKPTPRLSALATLRFRSRQFNGAHSK